MTATDVQSLFREAASRFGDAVAIEYEAEGGAEDRSICYGELERRSNRLARHLAALGAGAGVPVAILSEDTASVVTAILGVLKAGAAFVPLDPRLPPARMGAMLDVARPALLLADNGMAPVLASLDRPKALRPSLVPLGSADDFAEFAPQWERCAGSWTTESELPFAVAMDPDAFCYIYFTSGSTGQPKGIAGRLKGIDHFIRWEIDTFGVGPGTRVSQLTTPSFDAFLRDVFTPLCAGGTVCVPGDRARVLAPGGLAGWLQARRVNLMHCVPTVFRLLLNDLRDSASLPDLRWVLLAGEPVMPSDVDRWMRVVGDRIPLANLYGPSETTMTKFCHLVTANDARRRSVPIGRPMPGVRALIVDARNRPCAAGSIGDILIRTPYRTLGYYRRPDLTAEVFVPNPFAKDDPHDIVYRTGDLGRMLEDGSFELIGRRDQQVKIRGVRVELKEIEGRLRELPQVADVAVVARDDVSATKVLTAYVVLNADVSTAELRAWLAATLPDVMIPAAFVPLRELPRTITGKVDHSALPEHAQRSTRPPHIVHRTATEEILVGLWSQLLALDQIGINDNFFDLGGHSILALQMLARIKDAFRVDIPVATLFDAPTLGALAASVDAALGTSTAIAAEPLVKVPRDRHWQLSFTQQRLWFLEQLTPHSAAYHTPAAIHIDGRLDADRLEASLNLVLRRQEGLRTGFRMEGQTAYQFIAPDAVLTLRCSDLSDLPPERTRSEVARIVAEGVARPFDLAKPPLMRAMLIRLAETEHLAVFVMHHLVFDAWSIGVLCRDIAAAYRAAGADATPLPDLPYHYLDFAVWQRRAQEPLLEKRLAFWRSRLADIVPLQLPLDRPRPAVPSFRGARRPFALDARVSAALRDLARRHRSTLFMVLLAAFKSLLHRYTGQTDIAVGTPIANRPVTEMEDVVGFFANTLVLRTDLAGDPSFAELLTRVRRTALDAYAYQDLPFDEVVRLLQPERDLSRQPLFQLMFALQNAPMPPIALPDLVLSEYEIEPGTARFDLTVELHEAEGRVVGHVDYAIDLFDAETVDRLLGHFGNLLTAVAADPHLSLSVLPMLSTDEQRALLPPAAVVDDPRLGQCLHELFALRAAETPNAFALVFRDQRLTYRELDDRTNRLANYLRGLGIGPEARVALFLGPSADMVVAVLGVLKAGGAYVPMDLAYPADRLAFVMNDTGARLVVTQHDLLCRLPTPHPRALCLDDDWIAIAHQSASFPSSGVKPGNAAYIIYTSGSTGRPKGVLVEHRNVVRLFLTTEGTFAPGPNDVWTMFHSYAFDFAVWEMWGALLYGGRLVVVPFWQTRSPDALLDLLTGEGVTVLNQTPSAFWQLAHACEVSATPCPPKLRLIIFGGEALDFRRLRGWVGRHGDERPRLINMYGITETTVHVTCRPIDRDDILGAAPSVIGLPLPDLSLYVLDRYGQPVPHGVAGELHVGGAGLARGYLNRPAMTAERFVPNPFGGAAGTRLYRSGDRARRRADGEIEYLGRIDRQVKVRGFRIELAEIEAVLADYAAVRDAVVLLREDVPGETRLVAYVTWRPKRAVLIEDLRRFAAERLPDYMIPAAVVVLDELPLTRNGKADRAALLPPPAERPELATEFVGPRTDRERLLAAIWAEVLGLEKIGVRDNFFVLGGDSIRSIQVCARAQERGLNISVQQLFRLQTIDSLLRDIAEGDGPRATQDGGAFTLIGATDLTRLPEDVEDAYPLAILQLGMLYHSDLNEGAATYHDILTYRLRARFASDLLRQSLDAISARHPILRTSFDLSSFSEPLQLVYRRAPIPVTIEDLSGLSADGADATVATWIDVEKHRRRDWRRAPLLDIRIHRLHNERFQFTMSFHHAILDGWSVASFLTELFQEYFSRLEGLAPPALTAPALCYRQFVALERQTVVQRTSRHFWEGRLSGSSFIALPRWPGQRMGVVERQVPIPSAVSEGLKRAARSVGVPIKSVLLAAHARVLGLLGDSADVITGMVVHTRLEEMDGERVLGLFLNTLPVRLDLRGGYWTDLAARAFEAEAALLPHRRYPLALIQRDRGGAPLFETVFNFTHYHVYGKLRHLTDAEVIDGRIFEETNYALTANFSLDPQSDEVRLSLLCDGEAFGDDRQLDALTRYYAAALADLVRRPDGHHEVAALMTAEEMAEQIALGRGSSAPPVAKPVHVMVSEQALRTPDDIAVEDRRETLTYAELERRAGRLARHLCLETVGPDVLVALCLPRSVDLVVGMLAVLKAGGAYLPLDPDYPRERLAYMMTDAGHPLLLTHGSLPDLGLPGRVLRMDALLAGPAVEAEPVGAARPHSAAYVIYTSGSTGQPKGVVVPHGALSNVVAAMTDRLGLGAADRWLAVTSLSFDIAALELLLPLGLGAAVVIADRATVQDPMRLSAHLEAAGITVMQATPTVWQGLIECGWRAGSHLKLLCGGEVLDRTLADRLIENGARLLNLYGPTETTIWSSIHPTAREAWPVPLGRPILNTQIYVLDRLGQPVPLGVRGEIYIGGSGVVRGYLGRPRLTSERFVPDPFGPEPGGRLYRTGDLARWLPGNRLEFLGRIDHQVKIRGHRIELGEIEAVLATHPSVGRCVAALKGDAGAPVLVAYFTCPYDTPPAASALRRWLLERVPAHMVPAELMQLDVLPLTPNGKIDRQALSQLAAAVSPAPHSDPTPPPRDRLELELAQLWEEVLDFHPVGVRDHLTRDLGCHSLQAVRLAARIRERFDLDFGLAKLLQGGTVELVADALRHRYERRWTPLVPLQPAGDRRPLFCVHPAVGNVLCYLALARRIGRSQPLFGLQAPEADGGAPVAEIEGLAALYVSALRAVQPDGPYLLAGHSFGGLVAFEMARQLHAAGEQVALLALIDTILPEAALADASPGVATAAAPAGDAEWLAATARTLERYFGHTLGDIEDLRALPPELGLERLLDRLVRAGLVSASAGRPVLEAMLAAQKSSERMAEHYRPLRYDGPVTLIRAQDQHPEDAARIPPALIADAALGWGAFVTEPVRVATVPGDHLSMLTEPLVQGLADVLVAAMDAVHRQADLAAAVPAAVGT